MLAGNDGPVAAVPRRIVTERRLEILVRKIRPKHGEKNELGVGRLPEQKIADPLLARCADHQVRVGNASRIKRVSDGGRVDLLRA